MDRACGVTGLVSGTVHVCSVFVELTSWPSPCKRTSHNAWIYGNEVPTLVCISREHGGKSMPHSSMLTLTCFPASYVTAVRSSSETRNKNEGSA